MYLKGKNGGKTFTKRPPTYGDRPWEAPGATQEPGFIERRLNGAKTIPSVFKIVLDQGFCMTEDNLTTAFIRLAILAETYEQKCEVLGTAR